MNAEQQDAFTAAVRGHNALIFGQAGTGKTFLMKAIVQDLKTRREIALLCTTGMATLQYFELGATTVHSYKHLKQRYENIFLNSSQIEMLNSMTNEGNQGNSGDDEEVLKGLGFATVDGDGDICCSTRTQHFANTTLVNIYGILRSVIHLPDASPPSYQYIPHGSCLFTGLCPGRCQPDQKVLTLLVLNDKLDLLFDLFAIPGHCSCKNI